jgi:hypothetical protein
VASSMSVRQQQCFHTLTRMTEVSFWVSFFRLLPMEHTHSPWIGIWSAMRNSGSIIGGAINFSTNHTNSAAGGIKWSTYLIFVGFG